MKQNPIYSENTPAVRKLAELCRADCGITPQDYLEYGVKRGLRDNNGKGVLTGLTEVASIIGTTEMDGRLIPCEGILRYRGYDIHDLVDGFIRENRFGFEEVAWLLMFGRLPDESELREFRELLGSYRVLPTNFVRDVVMKAPSADMMNALARCVLTNASYDTNADDTSLPNVVRQCMQLIAKMPMFAVYGYQSYSHYIEGNSLYIHTPDPKLSTAENILMLLRPDMKYTDLEAKVLDLCLVLHAEHGGGNNSSFTMRVVTSSGTDTYSAVAASLASLKGPRHGGANRKVVQMMDAMEKEVGDWSDEDEIAGYLSGLLAGERFDKKGLIYGMGHAVYSISDPRAVILKKFAKALSDEKGLGREFDFYSRVERIAPEVIGRNRKMYKGVCANVDFYSGFVYEMLGIPMECFTPMFAVSRMAGWSAHRLEELVQNGKIIRPAYRGVCPDRKYVPMAERFSE
jgi:citrate synthase